MPHALIAAYDGSTVLATEKFADHIAPSVKLVTLVDFDNDCVGTSLDVARALGPRLSGEKDLGLEHELNQASLELMFRMLDRHRIRADFFQLKRNGTAQMTRQVQFGDDTYTASDQVVTTSDIRFFGLTYTYSFIHAERFEFRDHGVVMRSVVGEDVGAHQQDADGSTRAA